VFEASQLKGCTITTFPDQNKILPLLGFLPTAADPPDEVWSQVHILGFRVEGRAHIWVCMLVLLSLRLALLLLDACQHQKMLQRIGECSRTPAYTVLVGQHDKLHGCSFQALQIVDASSTFWTPYHEVAPAPCRS
jgi:hypothetical protein